jgi:lysyl-tRNA synthetase class I
LLHELPDKEGSEVENKANQRKLFSDIYQLLFGDYAGPRLGEFLMAADQAMLCKLLDV